MDVGQTRPFCGNMLRLPCSESECFTTNTKIVFFKRIAYISKKGNLWCYCFSSRNDNHLQNSISLFTISSVSNLGPMLKATHTICVRTKNFSLLKLSWLPLALSIFVPVTRYTKADKQAWSQFGRYSKKMKTCYNLYVHFRIFSLL